jgi:hypothetical protein
LVLRADHVTVPLHFITSLFVATTDGMIYVMNFARQEFVQLFPTADSCVAAIDVHDEMCVLV